MVRKYREIIVKRWERKIIIIMAGYVLEFKEDDFEEVVEKMRKAKKAVCEAFEALDQMDGGGGMSERGNMHYRNGMSRRDDWDENRMEERRNRMGRYY